MDRITPKTGMKPIPNWPGYYAFLDGRSQLERELAEANAARIAAEKTMSKSYEISKQALNERDQLAARVKELEGALQVGDKYSTIVSLFTAQAKDDALMDWADKHDVTISSDEGFGDGPAVWTVKWFTGNRNDRQEQTVFGDSLRDAIRSAIKQEARK